MPCYLQHKVFLFKHLLRFVNIGRISKCKEQFNTYESCIYSKHISTDVVLLLEKRLCNLLTLKLQLHHY